VQPQTWHPARRIEAGQPIGGDSQPPAFALDVDVDDASGEVDRSEAALEHRYAPFPRRLAGERKTGCQHEERQRRLARPSMPAQEGAPTD